MLIFFRVCVFEPSCCGCDLRLFLWCVRTHLRQDTVLSLPVDKTQISLYFYIRSDDECGYHGNVWNCYRWPEDEEEEAAWPRRRPSWDAMVTSQIRQVDSRLVLRRPDVELLRSRRRRRFSEHLLPRCRFVSSIIWLRDSISRWLLIEQRLWVFALGVDAKAICIIWYSGSLSVCYNW